jgi:hypothetical protein
MASISGMVRFSGHADMGVHIMFSLLTRRPMFSVAMLLELSKKRAYGTATF